MPDPSARSVALNRERRFFGALLAASLGFALVVWSIGWDSNRLPGIEFRQAQTALSIHFIQKEQNFSLAYPTPVLGKPWSIPMEFPLYQWTVVRVSDATGLGIVQAGRAVGIGCFLATLPAVFLLLGHFGVSRERRTVALALFLTSPLLLFYSRAVLIETMALAASLWFVVAFLRAVARRSGVWLIVAAATGAMAGLVKVTTLMLHLLPLVAWCLWRLWRERKRWATETSWMIAAVSPALAASAWWVARADAIKALNPLAGFLDSGSLRGFNLGTAATRFSAEMWDMKLRILQHELTFWPLLIATAIWAAWAGVRRGVAALGCAVVFLAALEIFPELYAHHDYYYVANVGWLLLAIGLVLVGLFERIHFRVAAAAVVAAVTVQAGYHWQHYVPQQRLGGEGGDTLSLALALTTQPEDVIVIAGQDWNSMTAYHARRRAVMLRTEILQQPALARQALQALAPDRVGALVLGEQIPPAEWLTMELERQGFDRRPVVTWRGHQVFLPQDRVDKGLRALGARLAEEVELAEGRSWPTTKVAEPINVAGGWVETMAMPPAQVVLFDGMRPVPTRFYSQFGTTLERENGRLDFGAHPVTRLVWALPAGRHLLRTKVFFSSPAYAPGLIPSERTDGVQVILRQAEGTGSRVFFDHLVDPVRHASARNRLALAVPFELARAGEVELFIGPGPANQFTRDWFWLDRITIERVDALSAAR